MESPITITRFNKIGAHRYDFDFKLALDGEDAIEFRANALVESYSGGFSFYCASRYNGTWFPLVVLPPRIHTAVREAALQALESTEPAEAVEP